MSASPSAPSEKELVFAGYYQDLEVADDKPAVVHRFVAAYPQWAKEFYQQAALEGVIAAPVEEGVEVYPDRVPDFSNLREIGRGGMGVVFEAWQESLQRRVALKIRRGASLPNDQERFRREQLVLAQLHHTHIVPVHTTGQVGPWQYYAMAYIEGAALHHVNAPALYVEIGACPARKPGRWRTRWTGQIGGVSSSSTEVGPTIDTPGPVGAAHRALAPPADARSNGTRFRRPAVRGPKRSCANDSFCQPS